MNIDNDNDTYEEKNDDYDNDCDNDRNNEEITIVI